MVARRARVCQEGDLVCLEARGGKRVWHRNLLEEFGGRYGGWHYCESPLVDGDKVIVTPGGKDATMVALAKTTGETVWKCAIPTQSTEFTHEKLRASIGQCLARQHAGRHEARRNFYLSL
jgi:outer membrane protein assembly factor BamB